MGVLSQDIGSQIEVLVLAVEENQVWEGFRRERWVLQQEIELFEAS